VEVSFAGTLHAGEKQIQIKTIAGSWFYDAIQLLFRTVLDWPRWGLNGGDGVETTGHSRRRTAIDAAAAMRVRRFAISGCRFALRVKNIPLLLRAGLTNIGMLLPAVTKESMRSVVLEDRLGQRIDAQSVTLKPVPKLTVYVLPHSHTDIGYTEIQSAVAERQVNNLLKGIECARLTATNPPGARFVWNVEVLWAADLFMRQMSAEQKRNSLTR
jgi:hypothetical protein